jgi:DNA repair exonuclease SbcCD ATPase subunit
MVFWKGGQSVDGGRETVTEKRSAEAADSARVEQLRERLDRLLHEAANVEVELSRADGSLRGVPHYSLIEGRAHELGRQLSREVQQRQMNELAASQAATAKCPACGTPCRLRSQSREVKSVDGETDFQELVGDCPRCRRSFFPDARDAGL